MGKYKKIKKRTKNKDITIDQAESAKNWLQKNMERIALGLGAVIMIAAIGYGVVYYKKTNLLDTNDLLYKAQAMVPPEKGTVGQAEESIAASRALITKGGPDSVIARAHMNIGRLLMRQGEYSDAVEEFTSAIKIAGKHSILGELAMANVGNTYFRAKDFSSAEKEFRKLATSATQYPKADAQLSLAYALAGGGKKDEAIGALNKLKADYPAYMNDDLLEDTLKHIEADRFVDIAMQNGNDIDAGSTADNEAEASAGRTQVHGSATPLSE